MATDRGILRRMLHEPLLHFLILGALIFGAAEQWNGSAQRYRIVIGSEQMRRIADNYARQYGGPPSSAQLAALVDGQVQEEILYREGLALHLDRDDEIVRRRIAQKFDFLQQDLAPRQLPSEAELEAFYRQHQDRYLAPARASFSHVYFSPDQSAAPSAELRASKVLPTLSSGTVRAPQLGDRFSDRYDYAALSPADVARLFGESAFANAVFKAPPGRWAGPFPSGLGWHLIYVNAREAARVRPLAEIHAEVLADFQDDARRRNNAEALATLKRKYTIVLGAPANAAQR